MFTFFLSSNHLLNLQNSLIRTKDTFKNLKQESYIHPSPPSINQTIHSHACIHKLLHPYPVTTHCIIMLRSLHFKTFKLLHHIPRRCFHPTYITYKDEKILKNLADLFQKGDIRPVDEQKKDKSNNNNKEEDDEDSSHSSTLPTNQIDEFESYSVMNRQQFLFQMGLDGDKPFMSFHNPHFVDSKQILRNLPDQIDVLDPKDMKRVEEIYGQLQQLDSNPAMHEKFLKRYFYDYDNDLMKLGQYIRGINSKFKMLRRNESEKFNPESVIHEYVNDKMKHPYNVVGFDRSFMGMPLHKNMEKPQYYLVNLFRIYQHLIPKLH